MSSRNVGSMNSLLLCLQHLLLGDGLGCSAGVFTPEPNRCAMDFELVKAPVVLPEPAHTPPALVEDLVPVVRGLPPVVWARRPFGQVAVRGVPFWAIDNPKQFHQTIVLRQSASPEAPVCLIRLQRLDILAALATAYQSAELLIDNATYPGCQRRLFGRGKDWEGPREEVASLMGRITRCGEPNRIYLSAGAARCDI